VTKFGTIALSIACALLVGACEEKERRGDRDAHPRPVLTTIARPDSNPGSAFAGTIEPRYTAILSFRVVGRIVVRDASVGDVVAKGTRLAAVDPVPYDLAVRTAQAAVVDADAQFVRVEAEERRVRLLRIENHASEQQYEAVQQALEAARAGVTQSRSVLDKAREQRGYADLRAEFDGVVTAVVSEVNQVVTPGQPVIVIARPDVREAVIDLPDDVAGTLTEGTPFRVGLQIAPAREIEGRVREIAPRVDALTRSRRVKIALADPPSDYRLGSMITARAAVPASNRIDLPAEAVFVDEGGSAVWIVDPASRTVVPRPVEVARRDGTSVEISAGLVAGDRVVTAGVHSLVRGQSVTVPEGAPQ